MNRKIFLLLLLNLFIINSLAGDIYNFPSDKKVKKKVIRNSKVLEKFYTDSVFYVVHDNLDQLDNYQKKNFRMSKLGDKIKIDSVNFYSIDIDSIRKYELKFREFLSKKEYLKFQLMSKHVLCFQGEEKKNILYIGGTILRDYNAKDRFVNYINYTIFYSRVFQYMFINIIYDMDEQKLIYMNSH